ncbi:hypothetical protein ACOME3_007522 [Neoechinorhynchus agilis]
MIGYYLSCTNTVFSDGSTAVYVSNALRKRLSTNSSVNTHLSLHVGLTRNRTDTSWSWLNGKSFNPNFAGIQWLPSHHPFSDCGTLNVHQDGTAYLSDGNCDELKPVICQYIYDQCEKDKQLCGSRGRCLSGPHDQYKCICAFFRKGKHCDDFDSNSVQTCGAFVLILLLYVTRPVLNGRVRKLGLIRQLEHFSNFEER